MSGNKQISNGGITRRIVRAASAQGINQVARILQLFLLVPVCLGAWGVAVYEDWILLNSVTAFLMLADLGFVQLTTVKLIDAWSRGERERFSREWALALGVFATLSAALISLLGLCWAKPGWTSLIPVRQLPQTELATTAVLLSLDNVLSILINLGLAAYRARGDLSRSYHFSSALVALQASGIAIPVFFGAGPAAAAMGCVIVTAAMMSVIGADLCRRYPDMAWKPIWPSVHELSRRVGQAVGYLASPVSTTIMMNGPALILAHSGAPEGALALFTASRSIAGAARQLPYQFAHPAGVELAGLLARGDHARLSQLYASTSRVLAIIVGMLSGFTVVAAPLVMMLWTRGNIAYESTLMLLLLGTTAICAPAQVAFAFLWYGGHPRPLTRALLCTTALAMALAVLLAPWFGARGVATGLGVGEIIGTAIYLSLLVDGLLDRKAGTGLLRNFGRTLASFSGSAAAGYLIYRLVEPRGWFGLVALGVVWALPAAAAAYWLLLSRERRARAIDAVVGGVTRATRARSSIKNARPADVG